MKLNPHLHPAAGRFHREAISSHASGIYSAMADLTEKSRLLFSLAADQGYAPAGQISTLAAREQAPGICVGNANPILPICDVQSTVRLCLIGY